MKRVILVLAVLFFLMAPVLAAPYCKIDNYDGRHIVTGKKTGYVDTSQVKAGTGYLYLWMQEKRNRLEVFTNVEATVTVDKKTCISKKPRILVLPCFWCEHKCEFELQAGDYKVSASAEHYETAMQSVKIPVRKPLVFELKPTGTEISGSIKNPDGVPLSELPIDSYGKTTSEFKTFTKNTGDYAFYLEFPKYRDGFGVRARVELHPKSSDDYKIKFVREDIPFISTTPIVKETWVNGLPQSPTSINFVAYDLEGGTGYPVLRKMYYMFKDEVDMPTTTIQLNAMESFWCGKLACHSGFLGSTIYIVKGNEYKAAFYPHEYAHAIPHRELNEKHNNTAPLEESWANFISSWVRNSRYYPFMDIESAEIDKISYSKKDYSSVEWALTGVLWDVNKKYPGSVWEVTKPTAGGKLNTIKELYFALKNSPPITNKSELCQIFKDHGFDFDEMDVASWDSGCK